MRQLWRLAGEPRWVDHHPEGAAARCRSLAPPREQLDEPVEGRGGDTGGEESRPCGPTSELLHFLHGGCTRAASSPWRAHPGSRTIWNGSRAAAATASPLQLPPNVGSHRMAASHNGAAAHST
uniref:Uncharacterized protein n=1 Tax=Sphaerodactylus townsendi TaxID=933632 RepID=A0ACB8EU24_9SAUR